MKTDSLFYEIFQSSPETFFQLIGATDTPTEGYNFLSQEVKQTSFRMDGLLTPPPTSDLPLYFVEVMGYRDQRGDLYPSLFSEIFLYLNDYRPAQDWRAVLIFTQRRLDPGLPRHYRDFDDGVRLQRVYLDELPAELADQSLELGLVYLIGLQPTVVPQSARQLIERASQELEDVAYLQKILELVQRVCVYKFPELTESEVLVMLGLDDLRHTRVYQDGMQDEAATLVLMLLHQKFGDLSPDLQAQIRHLPKGRLEALALALLNFSSQADLTAWLQSD